MAHLTRKLKVAAVQMRVATDIEENFTRIEHHLEEAARAGIELVVFPEGALSGYGPVHGSMDNIDGKALSKHTRRVRQSVARHGLFAFLGTSEFRAGGWHNMAYLISDKGRVKGKYSKVQLTPGDRKHYCAGTRPLSHLPEFYQPAPHRPLHTQGEKTPPLGGLGRATSV